ncbi:hypothetical protein Glove_168g91 [Diversispora epigaea]|uniref:Replication origin-binding protein domain-containing protein n=1 Tax=Diversispora epigaea TaxID=1348612 RepID=A0A397IT56_9GLOM|nr:hypothetical protein Glove_168g91 [Diversispora epigaea]
MKTHSAQVIRYGGGDIDDYSSDSDKYSDSISESGSENCSDYGSDYKSDTETTIKFSTSQAPNIEKQMSNSTNSTDQVGVIYTQRQEKFDNKFIQKDLINRIHGIASPPAREMLSIKGSLEDVYLWDYLKPNNEAKGGIKELADKLVIQKDLINRIHGIASPPAREMLSIKGSLEDVYLWDYLKPNNEAKGGIKELADKLVIQVEQGEYKKFSVVDDISEVYCLPGIHECIDGQKPLRPVIDIDASSEKMGLEKVNARDVFIRICCSYIRALYRILDCSWEEILKRLVIATSSDSSKCNYYLLYAPTLLIDYLELKEFTELVYKLTGEKYGKFIDRGLSGRNFNLRLIGSAKKDRVKRILQFSLDNGWNGLDHARVQPSSSLNIQKYSNYLGSWDIEEKDSQYFIYFNRKAYIECPLCKRGHEKDQRWYGRAYGNSSFIQKNKNNTPPPVSHKIKGPKFPKPFLEMPAWAKCDSPLTATEVYKKQYVKPLPEEGDVYVGSPWETGKTYTLEHFTIPEAINLLALSTRHTYSSAVTVRLNLKSYCDIDTKDINLLDYQRVVCQIESLHRIINKCKCEKKCKCPTMPYDLWLDEVVSVNSQAHTRLAGRSREHLYKLIHDARRIIVMDNDLTDLNIEWIKSLRKGKQFSVIHNTYQPQKGKTFRLAPNKKTVLAELWDWARVMSSLPYEERKSASLICHLRGDVQGITRALIREFPTLRIKRYHGKSDPIENAVTVRLNLKSYCDIDTKDINLLDYQRVVCQIESLHRIINKCKCEKKCKCPTMPYDLWLDEVVSVNSQAHTRLAGRSREHLYKLIHDARRIIVMDNDLTDLNIEWIKSLRKGKQFSVIHNTYQPQKGKTFRLAPNKKTVLAELWDWARVMSSLPYEERKSASLICHLRGDVQGITRALIREFPTLRIKRYHGKSDPIEKSQDFGNVDKAWKDVDLVAYTSTLKIGVSCTNPKFERAFCFFKSYIETNAGTNQMLFRMRCIKEYTCHIEQRASNLPITEKRLFHWLLKAKLECLPQELQNKGIFLDVESIIRNKDIPTVRLWVAHTLEKFRSRRLFGWRMVDFLKKAGMVVSIIKATPKTKDDTVSLTETVKGCSSAIKAEEISDIVNANILNHEMAEHLENKPKKTLEEMYALSRYHIAECYGVAPESMTEKFITDYGKYDEMKWFRNLRKLRDAGTNNETAVEAIIHEDYRNDRLTTVTQAEKHRICLELLKSCTPVKDIDDRDRYKADIVKACLELPKSMKYLQNLVPKMARVFDNTDASRGAKKSGLKFLRAKLGLLNSALFSTYGIKYKAIDNNRRYYHLVGAFDNEDAPKLPSYQTGEGPFYESGEDIRYGYSKLSPDELETPSNSISQDTQDLFDIC